MSNNKGVVIVKIPPAMGGGGTIQVTFHDTHDPLYAPTANQGYASFSGNTSKNVGDPVTFNWAGGPPYTATALR